MKAHYPYLLATLAAVGCVTAVHADEASTPAPELQVTYNVGAQSDYIFRGISQTDRGSAGFAGVDATWRSSLYVGAWTSNVDFSPSGDPSTRQEYDLYGGWRPTLAGFAFDIGYIYYGYTHQPHDLRESYAEGYLKVSRTMGPVTLGVATYRSPDFPGSARRAHYEEANIAIALDSSWTLSGAAGRQQESAASIDDEGHRHDFTYRTWNAGVTYAINDHVSLDLRYWNTDEHDAGDIYHAHTVASIKATF
jgi:uncharacterized protein (TIGR02001 family)